MKKYLIAAALIVGFSAPALADEIFVMLDMDNEEMRDDGVGSQRYEKSTRCSEKYPTTRRPIMRCTQ